MTYPAVTDGLLDELIGASHAEGTTCLAVAAAIEDQDRTLLIATPGDDFEQIWQLPADLVLPGETLLRALARTVSLTTGLAIIEVTGYTGHHDRLVDDHIVRTFIFTVTADDPERICRWANIAHRWTSDPITAHSILGEVDGHPVGTTSLGAVLVGPARPNDISAALRAGAKGLLCVEAAVELLIKQQSWLYRRDFTDHFVDHPPSPDYSPPDDSDIAFVEWTAALDALDTGLLACSSGEGRLLRIAGSLADGIPLNLRDAITGLDAINTRLVAGAVRHAAGHHA